MYKKELIISTIIFIICIFFVILIGKLLGVVCGTVFSVLSCIVLFLAYYHYNDFDWS